jgi:hypothetical protein
MRASGVNDLNHLRERAAGMRASSKELKDNNTAAVILRLAELYDRLAQRAEIRSHGDVLQMKRSRRGLGLRSSSEAGSPCRR